MKDDPEQGLEREAVLFFGAMGAGLSHELSNVFNIINELAGLQQDIAAAAAESGAAVARVTDLAARVKVQVERGETINRSLHRLSHSIDDVDIDFDLGETLVLFGTLAARAARLAEVEIEIRPPEAPLTHRGSPFDMLVALHSCMRVALAAASAVRHIGVWAEEGPGGIRVIFASGDPLTGPDGDLPNAAVLKERCNALGAVPRLEAAPDGACHIVLDLEAREGTADVQAVEGEAEV